MIYPLSNFIKLHYFSRVLLLLILSGSTSAQVTSTASNNPYKTSVDSLYRKMAGDHSITEEDFKAVRSQIYTMSDNAYFEEAENYLQRFLILANEKGTTKDKALMYHCLGYNSKKKGAYNKALEYYKKSIAFREEIGDKDGMAPTLSNMGNIYYDMGAYSRAIEEYRKSLSIRREIKDEKGMAHTLSGIGNVWSDQRSYDEAEQNYWQALVISKRIKDTMQIASIYTSLAGVKYLRKDFDSSLYFSQQSLKYANAIEYGYIAGYALAHIGAAYIDKGDFSKAEDYLKRSLVIREQLQSPLEIILSQLELARLFKKINKPEEARAMAKAAYEVSEKINFLKGRQLASELLAESYQMNGDYQNALDYYVEFKTLSDSLFTIEESKIIDDVKTQMMIEKETLDLKLEQSKQRAFYKLMLLSMAIILVAILLWFLYSKRLREKQNEIMIKQKELESEQKVFLSTQNERKRISQDMHDDLGTNLSGLRIYTEILMDKAVNEKSKEEHLKLLEMAKEATLKVRDIVWTLDNKNDSIDSLTWYCHQYAKNLLGNFPIQLNCQIDDDLPKLKINGQIRKQIFLTVKEALNNILKHSEAKRVKLSFKYIDGIFMIKIADNGKGFNVYQSTFLGNGIHNMENRMQAIQGNFQILSDFKGSIITLTLKIPPHSNLVIPDHTEQIIAVEPELSANL